MVVVSRSPSREPRQEGACPPVWAASGAGKTSARAVTSIEKKRIPPPASTYARGRAFCPAPAGDVTARTGPVGLVRAHQWPAPTRRARAAVLGLQVPVGEGATRPRAYSATRHFSLPHPHPA